MEQTKKDNLCPAAREDPKGCPYGGPSRSNCTDCQDLPIWWFDKDNSLAETKIDTDNVKSSQIGIDIQDG